MGSKPKVKAQASEVVKNWKENDVLRWINHHKLPRYSVNDLIYNSQEKYIHFTPDITTFHL